jgi:hypothetical protein
MYFVEYSLQQKSLIETLCYRYFLNRNISGAHDILVHMVHIKSDPSILHPTLLGRLADKGLFVKITSHSGGCFS